MTTRAARHSPLKDPIVLLRADMDQKPSFLAACGDPDALSIHPKANRFPPRSFLLAADPSASATPEYSSGPGSLDGCLARAAPSGLDEQALKVSDQRFDLVI